MKIYHLPRNIRALIFDMDLTLYTNHEYAQFQINSLVEKLGELKGLSFSEMKREVDNSARAWELSHNGKQASLSNIIISYGISMEENIRWRNEIFEPQRFIKEDFKLKETLEILSRHFIIGLVTNNPVQVARKTLAALGAEDYFPIIVGLDTCMIAKPHEKPFLEFSGLSSCLPDVCVSIGDRFDVDLDIPIKMGMGGILVDGVEDIYNLPDILLKGGSNGS
jgi:phosphoglycolate phosphatase/putative hydrolase of the HAD superfamily